MNILVVGDIGLDKYTHGTVDRISPEAPVPVVLVTRQEYRLGMAANVAANIAAMGATPILCSITGEDSETSLFNDCLKASGVEHEFLVRSQFVSTIVKERILTDQQQIVRVDYESADNADYTDRLIHSCRKAIDKCSVSAMIVQDYAKGCITVDVVKELCKHAKKNRIPVIVDPNTKTPLYTYKGCSLIIPNRKETEALVGFQLTTKNHVEKAARHIANEVGCKWVVIKLGKDGMAAFDGDTTLYMPTVARSVFDVSGAGDTAVSALAIELAAGNTFFHAVQYANTAAGLSVGKQGTSVVSKQEVDNAING